MVLTTDEVYNYAVSQCSISFGDYYSLKWQVIGKRVHFQLKLSNLLKDEDFWTGIGFSKIQVNSPVDESEVLAILRLRGAVSLEIFTIKDGKIDSVQSVSNGTEETFLSFAYSNLTSLDSNFTRSIHTDQFFNNSISECAIWTLYMKSVLMNETFVDPIFDALICNLSTSCTFQSSDNSFNRLHMRNRRQAFATGNTQTDLSNNPEIPGLYNPVINPHSPNYTAALRQNQEALSQYEDLSCILSDPYWCKNYVKQYINWQLTYNHLSVQEACVPLKKSVAKAHNRCCQAVRSVGC
uniref:DOMON domain-containing protein n=1 Tax=Setaria digitata TaxID=48799 RepID=A0A915PZ46_9BILA